MLYDFNRCLMLKHLVSLCHVLWLFLLALPMQAQSDSTYQELPDPKRPPVAVWATTKGTQVAWGSTDVRYAKHTPPQGVTPTATLQGWRGERLQAQAVVWTARGVGALHVRLTPFVHTKHKGVRLPKTALTTAFVRYVMTDELNADGGGCGHRVASHFDSSLVADVLDDKLLQMAVPAQTVQPLWIGVHLPATAMSGTYRGVVEVCDGAKVLQRLPLTIHVADRTLPEPRTWAFHLDLWQNPYAVARYHNLPVWSEAHLEAMRPVMQRLAEAGQKIITASIMHKPWNGQTEDPFESMVTWTKRLDGTWAFDYAVFDRWVEYMMSLGIDQQINCYSMVPWRLSFQYFDQATNSMQSISTKPGEPAYEAMWVEMLRSFAQHLRAKGWFERTTIAMDERPMDVMLQTLDIIRKADPDFKVSLAGNYHAELEPHLYDYCITLAQAFPTDVLQRRQREGKRSTIYTCCTEGFPNTFTFSQPAEATWLGFNVAQRGLDGYLRWAYNSWTRQPLHDSRFRSWAAGDCYLVYPEGRSSIRFERLIEGIQAYEKIRLLREAFTAEGNSAGLQRLDSLLAPFTLDKLTPTNATDAVREAQRALNVL